MPEHKRCVSCGQYKPLADFDPNPNGIEDQAKMCTACCNWIAQQVAGFARRYRQRRPAPAVSANDLSGR